MRAEVAHQLIVGWFCAAMLTAGDTTVTRAVHNRALRGDEDTKTLRALRRS